MSELCCVDCGVDVIGAEDGSQWYTVHADVWAASGMEVLGGFLCIACLERRIGRPLTGADLNGAPINRPGECYDTPRLAALKLAAWLAAPMEGALW